MARGARGRTTAPDKQVKNGDTNKSPRIDKPARIDKPSRIDKLVKVDRPAAPVERTADERLVDQAVAHLRKLVVVGQVNTLVQVGEFLIQSFYGSVENARSRSPVKSASLQRLAERAEEFGMSPANLRFVVPLALAAREIGLPLSGKLGVSRLRALLPLQDSTQRKLLAETAVASGLTVDKLQARVRQIEKPHPGGRPRRPTLERLIAGVARLLDGETDAARLRDGLDVLSPARARQLLGTVNRIQADLERVEKLLQRRATSRDEGDQG